METRPSADGSPPPTKPRRRGLPAFFRGPALWLFLGTLVLAWYVGAHVPPTLVVERVNLDVRQETDGRFYYTYRDKQRFLGETVEYTNARLHPERIAALNLAQQPAPVDREYVRETAVINGQTRVLHAELSVGRHWGFLSLLPALAAVALCWITREPVSALFTGIVAGAFILHRHDLTAVLVEKLATPDAAGVLLLYLWLLGGLMGIWSRTGAAQAFADFASRHFVRGPRSARLVAWGLGIVFFQGGTMSSVLVGTTVKPVADSQQISHEELSYIVDSTSSPIAGLVAFNAWPGYVQAFLFVPGVAFLATEGDRIAFFFRSLPFSFYSILAVLGTLLLAFDKAPFLGRRMRAAIRRARETGQLDAPGATPLSAKEIQTTAVPAGYRPHVADFLLPLIALITTAVVTFIIFGTPKVAWAFLAAVLLAMLMAALRGMGLQDLMRGYVDGLKGVVLGSVILMLAVTIGALSRETGGGLYLVEQLGKTVPYWLLPVFLQLITIVIAFSTGTSWGTFAVTFPLAMPLAWAIANNQGLASPETYMMLCFAAVLNGSIYGDQCSPISDTTVLSSMCTGCDLMDHVKTQILPASAAAGLAAVGWTVAALLMG